VSFSVNIYVSKKVVLILQKLVDFRDRTGDNGFTLLNDDRAAALIWMLRGDLNKFLDGKFFVLKT